MNNNTSLCDPRGLKTASIQPRGKPMKRRLTATLLMAGLAAAPLVGIPAGTANAQSVSRPSQDIVLSIGRGQLVTVPGTMADVFVANEGIADVQIKYARPAKLDDDVVINTLCTQLKAASVIMHQRAMRGSELLCEATFRVGFVAPNGRPTRQPQAWRDAFAPVISPVASPEDNTL